MRIKEIKIYQFDELSESAKEKAINNHREFIANDRNWNNENVDTLNAFEKIFPIKIKSWEYGYKNYVSWTFCLEEDIENLTGWRLVRYLWSNYKTNIFKGKYYSTQGTYNENGKYCYKSRHSRINLDNCCVLTGYYMDDIILKDIYEYMKKPDERIFYDLLNDCLYNWVYACRDEYEYQMSDEAIIESIKANEYEFDENGNLES